MSDGSIADDIFQEIEGVIFRMPCRGVDPTGRRLDLEQNASFMDGYYRILRPFQRKFVSI
jgi:hypothetical protein